MQKKWKCSLTTFPFLYSKTKKRGDNEMTLASGNKRLPVTLNMQRQLELKRLKKKYNKSESKLFCIALDLLVAQEKAGFDLPILSK